jgi:TP901 family phage tail tape measure protein
MATQFSILAKVKLDTSNIQSQLDNLKNNTITLHADTDNFELSISVANAVMREFIELAGRMVEEVYDLDKSLTEFKKVSDLRGNGLDNYVDQLGELGSTVARTTSDMVDAAAMFRKSGFTDAESAEMAQIASIFQNVADTQISAESAAASIVSQIQAFGRGMIEPIHIIDAYNETANNFAIGTGDLSRALELSAAGMATYGNSFEEVIGLVTAGTEIMVGRSAQVARGK